jgi:hypothetical protein
MTTETSVPTPSSLGSRFFQYKVLAGLLLGVLVGGYGVHFFLTQNKDDREGNQIIPEQAAAPSRLWMEYAEDIVREVKPAPPMSARYYAYVATAYSETLDKTQSVSEASEVTAQILTELVPSHQATTSALRIQIGGAEAPTLSKEARTVRDSLIERIGADGAGAMWDGTRPEGSQYWVGEKPASPLAGSWKRWNVGENDDLNVPPPPEWQGPLHQEALVTVKRAAAERTPEQSAAINFWGGVPGTEAPAGIWQNRLFDATKEYNLSDQEYAKAQKLLAQTLADAFMECWKVKYTYWTSRPSMNDATIDLAMPNPPFPSYLSGHSTISRAGAEMLGALFPAKRDLFIADAEEARNSRLWAGIHFPYDNEQGFALGEKVGRASVQHTGATAMR